MVCIRLYPTGEPGSAIALTRRLQGRVRARYWYRRPYADVKTTAEAQGALNQLTPGALCYDHQRLAVLRCVRQRSELHWRAPPSPRAELRTIPALPGRTETTSSYAQSSRRYSSSRVLSTSSHLLLLICSGTGCPGVSHVTYSSHNTQESSDFNLYVYGPPRAYPRSPPLLPVVRSGRFVPGGESDERASFPHRGARTRHGGRSLISGTTRLLALQVVRCRRR